MFTSYNCDLIFHTALLLLVSTADTLLLGPANPVLIKQLQQQVRHEAASIRAAGFRPEYLTDAEQKQAQLPMVEGDIELDSTHLPSGVAIGKLPAGLSQDAVRDSNRLWPRGRIPYVIDERFSYSQKQILRIAFEEFQRHTCIRFVEKTDADISYLFIRLVHLGCYSKVGWENQAKQRVSFHPSCFEKWGTVLHELMHSLGFFHEQSRTDRDDWVTIVWDNILQIQRFNFDKIGADLIFDYGKPYDYGSLLHYQDDAFARNTSEKTIIPKQPLAEGVQMGQRQFFSELDIEKINSLYNCSSTKKACTEGQVACKTTSPGGPQCAKPCDGVAQCSDGSDESQCPTRPPCEHADFWPCKSSFKCIPKSWLCDGTRDCSDSEDELPENCNQRQCNAQTEFDCGSGSKCIPLYRVCDGTADCLQGQDEDAQKCAQKRPQQVAPSSPNIAQPPPPPPEVPLTTAAPARPEPPACRNQNNNNGPVFNDPIYSPPGGGLNRGANRFQKAQQFFQQPQQGWLPINPTGTVEDSQQQLPGTVDAAQVYQCASTNQCYTAAQRCDSYWQCDDGSDEADCYPNQTPVELSELPSPVPVNKATPNQVPPYNPNFFYNQPQYQQPQPNNNFNNPYFSYFQPQPFGQGLQSLFNYGYDPYLGGLGFDSVGPILQRHCFIDVASLDDKPEIRTTPALIAKMLAPGNDDSLTPCTVVALGYAQINAKKLNINFSSSSLAALRVVQAAQKNQTIQSFVIVVGGNGGELHLRNIGSNVTKAMQFAENVRQQLRQWNATGVLLEWLRPATLADRASFNTIIKTLAEAMQFDPALKSATNDDKTGKTLKKRLIIGLNVLNAIQPAHDRELILANVDYLNVIPDAREALTSEHTFYTNRLLMQANNQTLSDALILAGSALHSNTWLLTATNQTLRRINIGIRFAPITWTLPANKQKTFSTQVGGVADALGAPGPLTGTAGTLNAGELCLIGDEQRLAELKKVSGYVYKPWKALQFRRDANNASFGFSPPERQWFAYESATSLKSKLRQAHLLGKFNGIYVVDAQADDLRGLCRQDKAFALLKALAEFGNELLGL